MASNSTPNSLALNSWRVFNGLAPAGLPRSMELSIQLPADNSAILIDLSQQVDSDILEFVQTIYVDNSHNPFQCDFTFQGTNQLLTIPAYCQAYQPVMCPNPPLFTVQSKGTAIVGIQLLPHPVPASVWNVADNAMIGGVNGQAIPIYASTNRTFVSINPAGVFATIKTAVAGKRYETDSLTITISADATLAVAGECTVSFTDQTNTVVSVTIYLPAAIPAGAFGLQTIYSESSMEYIHPVANDLDIQCNPALATGKITANWAGAIIPGNVLP